VAAARERPALALYLLALLTLGWKWLSPLSSFYSRAEWCDVLIAAAAAAWAWEHVRDRRLPRPRAFHIVLGAYLLLVVLSGLAAGSGGRTVLLVFELAVLAILSSDFASDPRGRDGIVLAVAAVALLTGALTLIALVLFYAGVHTGLLGDYGHIVASDRYTRVSAGFESPGLLSSFCIFASAVVAREDSPLPRRLRLLVQAALAFTVLTTLARGIIAFVSAWAIRAAHYRLAPAVAGRVVAAVLAAAVALTGLSIFADQELDPTRPGDIRLGLSTAIGTRGHVVEVSLDTVGDHPLLGEAPGARASGNGTRAHLTPLNVAATVGIPAAAILTLLVVVLWRGRRRPTNVATWSGLAGLGIDGIGQDIEHFRHVWVMLGMADAERKRD
jgi:hypothetical protein